MIPCILFGKAIGVTAGIMVRRLGSDTWFSMTIGFVIGTLVMLLTVYLCGKFPEKTVIEFSGDLLGKWTGKLVGAVLAVYFAVAYAASAGVMLVHLNEYFLPNTPLILITVLYTLLCLVGVLYGVEVIIRFSLVGFVMCLLLNLTMVAGTVKDIKLINLFPLMDKGLMANLSGTAYIFGDIAMAVLSVCFLYPMLNQKKKVMRITFWAMVVGAVQVILWPLFEIMIMGPDLMKQYVLVCMQQIRCAQLTQAIPRYELLMMIFFTFTMFVQSGILFWCSEYCIKQITGLKKDWVILAPLTAVLIYITNLMCSDHNDYINFLAYPYSQVSMALSLGLPVLLFFVALFRGKLKKKNAKLS